MTGLKQSNGDTLKKKKKTATGSRPEQQEKTGGRTDRYRNQARDKE